MAGRNFFRDVRSLCGFKIGGLVSLAQRRHCGAIERSAISGELRPVTRAIPTLLE
jgi:hypothetical protein